MSRGCRSGSGHGKPLSEPAILRRWETKARDGGTSSGEGRSEDSWVGGQPPFSSLVGGAGHLRHQRTVASHDAMGTHSAPGSERIRRPKSVQVHMNSASLILVPSTPAISRPSPGSPAHSAEPCVGQEWSLTQVTTVPAKRAANARRQKSHWDPSPFQKLLVTPARAAQWGPRPNKGSEKKVLIGMEA